MIRPKKSLGQHFLIDKNILDKIIRAAELKRGDWVLEIGAGTGILTKRLSQQVERVVSIEIDKEMVEMLKRKMQKELKEKKIEIIEGDILKLEIPFPPGTRYKLVANIPYQITGPILEKFLLTEKKPELMVLMVQKEVAQKICAQPPEMNRLAVLVQSCASPSVVHFVSKNCFWPKPEVESAILKIVPFQDFNTTVAKNFLELVKKGFSQKRKQLKNIFGPEIFKNDGILIKKRPSELRVEDWLKIYQKKNG